MRRDGDLRRFPVLGRRVADRWRQSAADRLAAEREDPDERQRQEPEDPVEAATRQQAAGDALAVCAADRRKRENSSGPKEIAIVAGISDNIYAIDVATGKLLWKKHFEYAPIRAPRQAGRSAVPSGTDRDARSIGPPNASGAARSTRWPATAELHSLNVANGEDVAAPFPFGYPNGKHYSLNLWNDVIFTTTSQGCAGNPNQMWAVNLKDPNHKVMTFNPKSGGLWGRSGAAIDSTGTAWAPTGDGRYDPANQVYGNGLIGAHVEGRRTQAEGLVRAVQLDLAAEARSRYAGDAGHLQLTKARN